MNEAAKALSAKELKALHFDERQEAKRIKQLKQQMHLMNVVNERKRATIEEG